MKRKMMLLGFLTIILGSNVVNVKAKDCTEIHAAPHVYQVAPYVNTKHFGLYTSYDSCYGSNTEVWFSSFTFLPDSVTNSVDPIWVDLMEGDPEGNEDELVKQYAVRIIGRTATDAQLIRTVTAGLIDSEGDKKAELYLRMVSGGRQGLSIEKSMFNYQICMK